jgi:predicted nuclease of predicted toxin-antitoxin system
MKLLVDMNLSPRWCEVFHAAGHTAVHWSNIGEVSASDNIIMEWARNSGYCVFTHDLDFSAILWTTKASGPSVIQVRDTDLFPNAIATVVTDALLRFAAEIDNGAIIAIDASRSRVRILPLG